jgi:putative polyhydroxyalkanoate system protein
MADIQIHRAHHLGLKGARAAAEEMAGHLGSRFGLAGDWSGNVFHFQRPGVTGSLSIGEKAVDLTVTLGFLLKAMKGSIEQAALHEMDKLFAAKAPAKEKAFPAKPKKAAARPRKGG